tara:strand:- start:119 stop:850 length:732 start_codon:yes stop_codon:yes gene_type:complete
MLFSYFIKNRAKSFDKKIEYYEDKVNHDTICNKLDIPHPKRYFVLDNIDDIRKIKLPDNCVIKYNNLASAKGIIFRKNDIFTNNFDLNQVIYFLKNNNKQNTSCQISIKNIKQKVIIDELLIGNTNSDFIQDIKLYAFKGTCKYILITEHFNKQGKSRHYDINFNRVVLKKYDNDDFYHKKPKHLNEIINYGNKIAKELFPDTFVRIDFYSTTKGPMFGEITFNPSGGNGFTKNADKILGKLL